MKIVISPPNNNTVNSLKQLFGSKLVTNFRLDGYKDPDKVYVVNVYLMDKSWETWADVVLPRDLLHLHKISGMRNEAHR